MRPPFKTFSIFLYMLIFLYSCGNSQSPSSEVNDPRWSPSEYRDTNWRPLEGNYFFSEMWTWSYTNDIRAKDDPKHSGEMSIYIDPPTGTMLLTKNDTQYSGDMIDWIIIHPNGAYSIGGLDEHGKPNILKAHINDIEGYKYQLESQSADFKKYVKPTGQNQLFGENQYGWPTTEGESHLMTYAMTNDQNQLYLTEVPFSMRHLYLVESVVHDIRLPIHMAYGYILPEKCLLLSDRYEYGDKVIQMKLKSMSPTEYFINTSSYVIDH